MRRRGAFLLALSAAAGCADTELVHLRARRKGPVPEVGIVDAGGGELRYPLKGPAYLVNKRRKRAFRKMERICGGEKLFRITRELTRDDADTPYSSTDLDPNKLLETGHYTVEKYRHIHFECVKKP